MRVEVICIGNSRGIRLPESIIEQCGLGAAVELHVEQNRIVITPHKSPRQGWAEIQKTRPVLWYVPMT